MESHYGAKGEGVVSSFNENGTPKYLYRGVIVLINGEQFDVSQDNYNYGDKEEIDVFYKLGCRAKIKTKYIMYKYVEKELNPSGSFERDVKRIKEKENENVQNGIRKEI